MYYTREYLNRAHREIDTIFRVLFPEHGMAVREEQIMLCHKMLDNLLGRNIALCDAGVGIGKTYAYLVACVLMRKYSLLAELHSRKQFLQNISLFSPGFFRRTGRFRPLLKL